MTPRSFWMLAIAVGCGSAKVGGNSDDGGGGADGKLSDGGTTSDGKTTDGPVTCVPSDAQILMNGDFEAGEANWTTNSPSGAIIESQGNVPITLENGDKLAYFLGVSDANQSLSQALTIPGDNTKLVVEGRFCFVTEEAGGAAVDTVTITVNDTAGTVLETLKTWSNLDAGDLCNWDGFSLTSTMGHGGARNLVISGLSNGSVLTSMFFDSLSVRAITECSM